MKGLRKDAVKKEKRGGNIGQGGVFRLPISNYYLSWSVRGMHVFTNPMKLFT